MTPAIRPEKTIYPIREARYYAGLYKRDGLKGGHVILLNPPSSEYYAETKRQALEALLAYPGGLQIGGGITDENAREYLDAGASHVDRNLLCVPGRADPLGCT